MTDSKPAIDALWLLEQLVNDFPGLLDGMPVNGSEMVAEMWMHLMDLSALRTYLKKGNA